MDMITIIGFAAFAYLGYRWGKLGTKRLISDKVIDGLIAKASVPIGVVEEIEGHYYVYEKDTTRFLGQAATLEELPAKLMENKIGLALLMYPEKSQAVYWCINGKLKAAHES